MSSKLGVGLTLLVVGLAMAMLVVVYDGTLLPNDAAQYLSVARHIAQGDGVKTDLVFFMEHHVQKTMPVEETGFAPGFPFLVAGAAAAGLPLPDAAFLVTCLSFGLAAMLLYSLVFRSTASPGTASVTVLLWLVLVFGWFNAWERLSELPFIVCTLLAVRLMPRTAADRSTGFMLAGVATAGAIAIRYAGTLFFLSVLLVLVVDLWRQRTRKLCLDLMAFAAFPVAIIVGLFWRNYRIIGDVKGGNELYQVTALSEVLGRFAKAILHLSGFSRAGFEELKGAEVTLMVAVLIALGLLTWQRRSIRIDMSLLGAIYGDRRFQIAIVYVMASVPFLLLTDLTTSVTVQARMLLVLAPFVLLLAGCLISTVRPTSQKSKLAVALVCLLLGTVYLMGQVQVRAWQHSRPNHYSLVRETLTMGVDAQAAFDFLGAHASIEHPLLGNEPQMLGAVIDGPVVGLPPPAYSDLTWDFEAVQSVVEDYGVEYIVFMPKLREVSNEQVLFFDRLAAEDRPSWLTLITGDDRLQLFRVAKLTR